MQQLTQKERQLLQEALKHEEVCIAKYGQYAQKLQDPQLQQMFQQLQQKEEQHYQTIANLLGSGGVASSPQMQQQVQGSLQQPIQGSSQQGAQLGGAQASEEEILQDMLMTEKYVADSYNMSVLDSLNSQVRKQLQHIQNEEQQHANQIVDAMVQKGYYQQQ